MAAADRAHESNLMLLCHDCHRMIDDARNVEYWTEERLTLRKEEHETRVRRVTDFATLQQTLVITTEGPVRGARVSVSDRHVTHALVEAGLVAHVDRGQRSDVLVRLPNDLTKEYGWQQGRDEIDAGVSRLHRCMELGADSDVSVFALAPIALLVYLGSKLDDLATVRVFDRHRDEAAADAWAWRPRGAEPLRVVVVADEPDDTATAVLVEVAVSGSARMGKLPAEVASLPRIRMAPDDGLPRPGLLESDWDLENADTGWVTLLAQVEAKWPNAKILHIVAAVPASLAIRMGQRRMRAAHPEFVVYELTEGQYIPTPAITDTKAS